MECYKCRAKLGIEENCPNCGVNVRMYKKLVATSNAFYNIGLERAGVRNLSGAVDALKISLQYYKRNIRARNLLGLIYYEMGETVSALSEWVISKNYQDKDNSADRYLNDVQNNPSLLNTINQTIKKYNQALVYCHQDNTDLAVIQLKKIISTNPKLVKAHQLLALLYIRDGKYDLAVKSLRLAEKTDHNNTITRRYLEEINVQSGAKADKGRKKRKKETTVEYHNGNETIIQPTNLRDNSGWMMILNILVGLVIGVTATYFLIVPSIRQSLQKDITVAESEKNDTIASKNQEIQELQDQMSRMEKEVSEARNESEASKTQIDSYSRLVTAFQAYHSGDNEAEEQALAELDANGLDSTSKELYESIKGEIDSKFLETTYNEGYSEYMARRYETAAQMLQKVVDMDDTYHNGDAVYYLAQSCRILQNYDKARELYQKVIDEYPSTYKAQHAQNYLTQMPEQTTQ